MPKTLKDKIIEILISPAKSLPKLGKIMLKNYPRDYCVICGHPLSPSKRINDIADQILEVVEKEKYPMYRVDKNGKITRLKNK